MIYIDALSKVLPVLLLILLGAFLRSKHFLCPETVDDLKKLVVNVTLPAVLFLAFARMALAPEQLIIVVLVFVFNIAALGYGKLTGRAIHAGSPYWYLLMAGFEAGMMGYAIYGAVYGQDNISKFALVDLGQVVFVFFVLVTLLQREAQGEVRFSETLLGFFKTPVILAILLGLLVNQIGWIGPMAAWPVSAPCSRLWKCLRSLRRPS
jgi:malate permease and related proteins